MKPLHWIGSCLKDIKQFPKDVQQEVGFAIHLAQMGERSSNAVALVGYGGASVLEVVSNHDGDTFRAIYTVKFEEAVYALHAFQKKSPRRCQMSRRDKQTLTVRLKQAKQHYEEEYKPKKATEREDEKGAHRQQIRNR